MEKQTRDRSQGIDLTTGSIPRHLLSFSFPMLAGNLIQIGQNIINTIWVGHLVGENAVGTVLSADSLLRLMKTPAENFTMASDYLKIILGGFVLFYAAFIINSVMRGIGDTVTPLRCFP